MNKYLVPPPQANRTVTNLDLLINNLRGSSTPGAAEVDTRDILQRIVFILPTIKNPLNLDLVIKEIINSPRLLPPLIDLHDYQQLTDAFRATIKRKALVTDPTISFEAWLETCFQVITRFAGPGWKKLPLLAGLILADYDISADGPTLERKPGFPSKLKHLLKREFVTTFDQCLSIDTRNRSDATKWVPVLACISIAQVYSLLGDVAINYRRFLQVGLDLIFSNYGLEMGTALARLHAESGGDATTAGGLIGKKLKEPVVALLNTFAHIASSCIVHVDIDYIDRIQNKIILVCENQAETWRILTIESPTVMHHQESVQYLKWELFTLCIIMQGIANMLLTQKMNQFMYLQLAYKQLQALHSIYFIVDQMGSQFAAYDYVFFSAIDVLLSEYAPYIKNRGTIPPNKEFVAERLAANLAGTSNVGSHLPIDRSRVLFALNYYEQLVTVCHDSCVETIIYPMARSFLYPTSDIQQLKPLVEAAHSVILAGLAVPTNAVVNAKLIPEYMGGVLPLFPGVFSWNQFVLAIQSIVNTVSPPSEVFKTNQKLFRLVLDSLMKKCRDTPVGIPVPHSVTVSQEQEDIPPTQRAVVMLALINSLPYVDIRSFELWLQETWNMIEATPMLAENAPNKELAHAEHEFLVLEMWKMISGNIDQRLNDVAIRWWYKKNARVHGTL
ncbi:peroxisomal membrane protein PEX17 [Yarrowia lipolytica]|jgi:hypothetical protein|uniref:Peroxisomal membrane protein PEX17 n=2 Tax=Yarrowia lipolytica TaxID=4952 RepID=PEX17_YARLI|nr:YALI0D00891p [Yarrowia lipolytica CLIB122]P87200.2 RecName: Full=Peroxisomal membrane protein PEX17; AltName: Full=Peroxin-17 [Yarrowia lipolytica CLIB122]AOW03400.1 hypothetical protein YALI1_D00951g [Yarrowia lipolytica]KAB8282569.1 peroxisomal membrane protein PEX17 [Yarrowia lipolytica]KAE8173219.1 peroxisomal membrane protein PEX17 [Yarrowia lipolytica]KAJ8054941.1 peroxisomal membrane protein PEX17 [Yarrowia lipolytica]QNP97574.1 Peroxisomal membrane protein PEX17 [Yarrowia lipolytic|eukprot:XP_502261.1 YALI0D00891p [Yarrowia lipolytica CLIB122]